MLVQVVQFESKLPEEELVKVCQSRRGEYEALPKLVQKYYLRSDVPNNYCGVLLWEDRAAFEAYRQSGLAQSVAQSYKVAGAPSISTHELLFPLRQPMVRDWVA